MPLSQFRCRMSANQLRVDVDLANNGSPKAARRRHVSLNTVRYEGRHLLQCFMRHELRLAGMAEPTGTPDTELPSCLGDYFLVPTDELCEAAASFSMSPLRIAVWKVVHDVELSDLSYETFHASVMREFDRAGAPCQRLLVTFYFCSDLVVRAYKTDDRDVFVRCNELCRQFVDEELSGWAHELGGWKVIISSTCRLVTANTALGIGLVILATAIVIYCLRQR